MASLTDTLSGPSGGKPIISTQRQSLDLFGTVANFGEALISASPEPPDPKEVQAAADTAANNMFVSGVQDILSFSVPQAVRDESGKIIKMQKAGLPLVQIDAEIQKLIKKVASKYPESKNDYYKWLNDQGLDDFVLRDAKRQLESEEKQEEAIDAAFLANSKLLNERGYPVDNLSRYQINKKAQEIYLEEAKLAASKKAFDEKVATQNYNASVNAEDRAAANFNAAEDARERTEAETTFVNDMRTSIATNLNPTIIELNKLTDAAINGELPETEYRAKITDYLRQLESDRATAISRVPGISKENRQLINDQFDLYSTFTKSLLDGDLSINKSKLRTLEAWRSNTQLRAIDQLPIYMILGEVLGTAGQEWIVQAANETPGGKEAQIKGGVQLGNFLGDIANPNSIATDGISTKNPVEKPFFSKMMEAFRSELPLDTSKLEGVIPATYNSTVKFGADTLPTTRLALINDPTKENATYFSRSFSSVVPELNKIATTSPSSERQVKAILKTIPPAETLQAIAAYEKAGGDTKTAERMKRTVSNAYGRALTAMYMDYTSESLGSMLSPMKTSGGTGRGPVFGTVVPKITYNEDTGLFQQNGREVLNVWAGTTSKQTVTQLNQLLAGAVAAEKALGSLPANMSDLGARAFLVKGLAGKEKWDQSVRDYLDESGYVAVSPGEILVEKDNKEKEAAKASGKKTEAPAAKAEPAKTDSSKRPDGTKKDIGWLGEQKLIMPDGSTGVATEYSVQSQAVKVEGKQIDFPTLVPTLTPQELNLMVTDIIPNGKDVPEVIMQKAIDHAKKRIAEGESPFFSSSKAPQLNALDAYLQTGLGDLPEFRMSGGSRSTYVAPTSEELKARMAADPVVAQVLAEIDRTESGGSYVKLYNNSETSEFSDVNITEKTVDELLEFTDPSGDYGQYVKNTRPDKSMGVSTPLGRYQIVGKTLRGLKEEMGLTGNEVFTPELQDQMFLFLLDRRLKAGQNLADEWQGFTGGPLDKEN